MFRFVRVLEGEIANLLCLPQKLLLSALPRFLVCCPDVALILAHRFSFEDIGTMCKIQENCLETRENDCWMGKSGVNSLLFTLLVFITSANQSLPLKKANLVVRPRTSPIWQKARSALP